MRHLLLSTLALLVAVASSACATVQANYSHDYLNVATVSIEEAAAPQIVHPIEKVGGQVTPAEPLPLNELRELVAPVEPLPLAALGEPLPAIEVSEEAAASVPNPPAVPPAVLQEQLTNLLTQVMVQQDDVLRSNRKVERYARELAAERGRREAAEDRLADAEKALEAERAKIVGMEGEIRRQRGAVSAMSSQLTALDKNLSNTADRTVRIEQKLERILRPKPWYKEAWIGWVLAIIFGIAFVWQRMRRRHADDENDELRGELRQLVETLEGKDEIIASLKRSSASPEGQARGDTLSTPDQT